MSRHHIPGARKRRDDRNPRKPSGWTRTGDRWSHPDGRTFTLNAHGDWIRRTKDGLYDSLFRGTGHPARFREVCPF